MSATSIQWTERTWNPVTGCTKISPGCKHCYAERIADRLWKGRQFTQVRCHPDRLEEPLRWRDPRLIFVNSMSDLFHERVPDEFICRVFGAMAAAGRHTFQVLTKRPERVPGLLADAGFANDAAVFARWDDAVLPWPLPNVWIGVSAENQRELEVRWPFLAEVPAAVRFLSLEPLLEPIKSLPPADWVIVGGESGPKARPCSVDWIRAILAHCRAGGIPCFVKQLGARPIANRTDHRWRTPFRDPWTPRLRDRKGGEPREWPKDLRVREWPGAA
jgi:protein gp37